MVVLPLLLYRVIAARSHGDAGGAGGRPGGAPRPGPALAGTSRSCRSRSLAWSRSGASAATLGLDSTAVAFLGLGVLLATGVLTLDDIAKEGDVLATFIWFAVLFTMSGQLNELGFMGFLGERLAARAGGLSPRAAGVALVLAYVLLHYLFVSQTAHLLALFGVFLDVGVQARRAGRAARVPAALCHQFLLGHHAAGLEREPAVRGQRLPLTQGELYRLGAITTAFNLVVYLLVGTPWLLFLYR